MICPRCESSQATKIFKAPEGACWEIYRCPQCYFVWRSTEEEHVTNPAVYDKRFKLDAEKIRAMSQKPPIPPLRNEVNGSMS